MFNDNMQAYDACADEPSLIFQLMKYGNVEVIEKLIDDNKININICDSVGNNVIMRLLKLREYELVLKLLKKRNLDINHQNDEGDTFGHILALDGSINTLKILAVLTKKKDYMPNIKNNKGETVLDRAINSNYICTAFKILEDKRFNCIDILSFKKLYLACLKNSHYGKYSKINNLDIIVDNLAKKDLVPSMSNLINSIKENMELIKNEIMINKISVLDNIINMSVMEATI